MILDVAVLTLFLFWGRLVGSLAAENAVCVFLLDPNFLTKPIPPLLFIA